MEKFGLPRDGKDEGVTASGLGKAALLAGALVAAGGAYVNHRDDALERQAMEHSLTVENTQGLKSREDIPLEAFYAVDEYKSILGNTWTVPSVLGSDSEQDKIRAVIAEKHGVSVQDFEDAFAWKIRDEEQRAPDPDVE